MKGGVTKRIEETIEALEKGQLKNALFLTDRAELGRHHAWIEEAARKALADRENTRKYLLEARDKLKATITNPLDDTSLERIKDYLTEHPVKEIEPMKAKEKSPDEMTDEELYENCPECHIANAIIASTEICERHPQDTCSLITSRLDKEDVQPEEWLKILKQASDQAEGEAKAEFAAILGDLTDYLRRRNSPFLKSLTEEDNA